MEGLEFHDGQLTKRMMSNSEAERKAIRDSKLRARIAERSPAAVMTMDQRIAAFKASVDGSDDDGYSHRMTNLAGDFVLKCEGGKDCVKSVCCAILPCEIVWPASTVCFGTLLVVVPLCAFLVSKTS